jgi:hypothetical protein
MPRCQARVGGLPPLVFCWALEFGGMGPLLGPSQAWGGVCSVRVALPFLVWRGFFRCGASPDSALFSLQLVSALETL